MIEHVLEQKSQSLQHIRFHGVSLSHSSMWRYLKCHAESRNMITEFLQFLSPVIIETICVIKRRNVDNESYPILVILQSTATEAWLDIVPCNCNMRLVWIYVVLHRRLQSVSNQWARGIFENISCYACCEFQYENYCQQSAKLKLMFWSYRQL